MTKAKEAAKNYSEIVTLGKWVEGLDPISCAFEAGAKWALEQARLHINYAVHTQPGEHHTRFWKLEELFKDADK